MSDVRDLVVIGCSAGGVAALPALLEGIPADFPAAIVIAQHMAPTDKPYLVDILRRKSALPVDWVEQGGAVRPGHVYVCPPGLHVMFTDGHLQLVRTDRENHVRPSIDKLFRSAAAHHGARVTGVLLTGMLDDGVAGLAAIREAGGLVIVQAPDDAEFPELPTRALAALTPDAVLPVDEIAYHLTTVVDATERVD